MYLLGWWFLVGWWEMKEVGGDARATHHMRFPFSYTSQILLTAARADGKSLDVSVLFVEASGGAFRPTVSTASAGI